MTKCSAPLCGNATYNKTPDITFHRFPKDVDLKRAWLKNMKKHDWEPTSASLLCSKHFEPHLIDSRGFRTVLTPAAIPTIFDHLEETAPILPNTSPEPFLPVIQNIQHSVFSLYPDYDEDFHKMEDKIRKYRKKVILKNKKLKILEQRNRRLTSKLLKYSAIISCLKARLTRTEFYIMSKNEQRK